MRLSIDFPIYQQIQTRADINVPTDFFTDTYSIQIGIQMYFKKIDVYTLTAKLYILLIYIQILYFKNFTLGSHLRGYPLHLHSPWLIS